MRHGLREDEHVADVELGLREELLLVGERRRNRKGALVGARQAHKAALASLLSTYYKYFLPKFGFETVLSR